MLSARHLTSWLIALLAIQIGGFLHILWFFKTQGYLPSPFVYDKSDSFMDFYHPLFWASHEGRYSAWQSVYPPLNFLVLQLVSLVFLGGERFADGFAIRDAHPELIALIIGMAIGAAALAFRYGPFQHWRRRDRALLFLFFILSPPFLFALERGNLIVLALPFFALALTRTGWVRMAAIAVLINLKPYFVVLSLVYVARRRFDLFILTGLLTALLFLVTGLVLDPDFLLFFGNVFNFSQGNVFSGREVLALPSSVSAFAYVLDVAEKAATAHQYFSPLTSGLARSLLMINKLILVFAALTIVFFSRSVTMPRLFVTTALLVPNSGVSAGGATINFVMLMMPIFLQFPRAKILVLLVLLLFLPLDLFVLRSDSIGDKAVYLSGSVKSVVFDLGLGSVLRPAIDVVLLLINLVGLLTDLSQRSFVRSIK